MRPRRAVRERRAGTRQLDAAVVNSFSHASHAILPSATTTWRRGRCATSLARCGRQRSRLPRAAACSSAARIARPPRCRRLSAPIHRRSAGTLEMLAKPARLRAAIRKSPDAPTPSPVNTRPVRFAPWAAGASPRISIRAFGSPNPGTGRAQYTSLLNAAFFTRPTSEQYARRRGHASQLMMASRTADREVGTALRDGALRYLYRDPSARVQAAKRPTTAR